MIDGIGSTASGRVDQIRAQATQRAATVIAPRAAGASASSPAAELASSGPPVDAEKVAAIRAAIAEGRYPIDAKAIADKMIALDLPTK